MKLPVKEQLYHISTLLPVSMLFLTNTGDCTYATGAFERLTGLEQEQVLGKGWTRYLEANAPGKLDNLLAGEAIDTCFLAPSGVIRVRLSSIPIEEELYCCTVENITREGMFCISDESTISKGAKDQAKLMQEILDNTNAILYSVDEMGRITAFNKAANQAVLLRKGMAIQLGDFWPDIVSGDSGLDKEKMTALMKYVLSGASYKTIEDIHVASGAIITYSVQASPIYDKKENVIGAVLCAQDITELTRLQRDAAEKSRLRNQELESWNKFYDMLLSVLAHDLRQPLSVVIMTADLFKYTSKEFSSDEIRTVMGNLRNTSSKSIELLQGLLHWVKSKKEDFSYLPAPLNLFDLVNEANALFDHDQKKKGIHLRNEIPHNQVLYAHQQMMLFVCRNLINNATKYAFRDSVIFVSSSIKEYEITILIKDHGKGMSEEQLRRLFSFGQSNAGDSGIIGVGMALTIASEMIRQMNGRISVESELGKGSSFYITFPTNVLI